MSKFEDAIKCPVCVYSLPQEVLDDPSLNKSQKIQILQQWEQDALQIITADEENMVGESPCMLNRVKIALSKLND